MKSTMEDFEESWAKAISCDGWALLRKSARRFHLLRVHDAGGRSICMGRKPPVQYRIWATVNSVIEAVQVIKDQEAKEC